MSGYNQNDKNSPIPPPNSIPIGVYEIPNTQNPPPGVVRGAVGGGVYPPNIVTPPPYYNQMPSPYPTAPCNPPYYGIYPPNNNTPYSNVMVGQEPYKQPFPYQPTTIFNPSDPYGMTPAFLPYGGNRPAYYPPAQGQSFPTSNNSQVYNPRPNNYNNYNYTGGDPNFPRNYPPSYGPSHPGYGRGFGGGNTGL